MRSKCVKEVISAIVTFIFFGCLYMLIEVAFRGYTSWTMGVLAGFISLFIGGLNYIYSYDLDLLYQMGISTVFATLAEGVAGIIINTIFKADVWDYSDLPGTFFWGQCNLLFCLAWFGLSLVCIVLQDCLVYYILKTADTRPYYKLFGKMYVLPLRKN